MQGPDEGVQHEELHEEPHEGDHAGEPLEELYEEPYKEPCEGGQDKGVQDNNNEFVQDEGNHNAVVQDDFV